jgi:hypothetical protein
MAPNGYYSIEYTPEQAIISANEAVFHAHEDVDPVAQVMFVLLVFVVCLIVAKEIRAKRVVCKNRFIPIKGYDCDGTQQAMFSTSAIGQGYSDPIEGVRNGIDL